jgi:DNA-binding LacI/PurR family transcriptional regulator
MASTIGIVSIGQVPLFFTGRYFREILAGAGEAAVARGCQMKLLPLGHDQAASTASARAALLTQGVDALLVVAPSEALLAALGELFNSVPGIVVSPPRLDIPHSYVASDNFVITRRLVEHLADHGRHRVLLLRPDVLTGDYWERTRGYAAAVAALDMPRLLGDLLRPVTPELTQSLLTAHAPDAIIAPCDEDAVALLTTLRSLGRRVPEDVAVVGYDDDDYAAETNPPLTTVEQPIAEMARRATHYLADRLAGVERRVYHAVLANRLVVRASCGRHS